MARSRSLDIDINNILYNNVELFAVFYIYQLTYGIQVTQYSERQ